MATQAIALATILCDDSHLMFDVLSNTHHRYRLVMRTYTEFVRCMDGSAKNHRNKAQYGSKKAYMYM